MIRRTASLCVRSVAGLVAGLALFAGIVVWRLSVGPISLDFLAPYVAEMLARSDDRLVVGIDHTLLRVTNGASVEIVARGVHLSHRGSGDALTLPSLSLGLSLRAALNGVVAPTRIALEEPELHIVRARDGTFSLGFGAETSTSGDWAEQLVRDLAAPPAQEGALGYLTRVAVQNATLTIDDQAIGATWIAKHAEVTLLRGSGGVFGDIAFSITGLDGSESRLHGEFRHAVDQAQVTLQLGFDDLRPALFAGAAPALAPIAALQLPFSGRVRVAFDLATLRLGDGWCEVSLGAGRLVHPALNGGSLALVSGELRAAYDSVAGRITLERLQLDAGGPRIEAIGTVDGLPGGILTGPRGNAIDAVVELGISNLPVNQLPDYWPEQLGSRAHLWVADHIHDGVAGAKAHIGAHIDLTGAADRPVRLDTFEGTLDYRGLTVDYFKPLPPARGVDGTATFDRGRLDLTPTTGSVEHVQVTAATIKLSKLDTDDEQIAIDLKLRGPSRDVLEVLDSEPLHYARALDVNPAGIGGRVEGDVHFNFPLKHDLALSEVDFGAHAALSDTSLGHVVADHDLNAGEFQLQLDRTALRLNGAGRIDDVPATLSWVQSLKSGDAIPTRYTVQAHLDDFARRRLDIDFLPDMVTGPVDADLTYTKLPAKRARASVSLDLKNSTINVAMLNWTKSPGMALNAELELDVLDEHVQAIRQATVKGRHVDMRWSLALDDIGGGARGVTRAEFPRLIVGETDASGTIARRRDGGWRVDLHGLSYDATGLVAGFDHPSDHDLTDTPLVIDATFDRLILGPKREAHGVNSELYSNGFHWQKAVFAATMFGGGKVNFRLGEVPRDRSFRLTTDDFGALMRLLGISDHVADGQLVIDGQMEDRGSRRLFRGNADGSDYRIVNAPLFAKLLSVASFSGIAGLLSGEGIPFTRLKSDFTVADDKLKITNLRAYGGAIGINVNGTFDFDADTLDIAGTLVPAYTLNSILGNIPVLGSLLLGGEGQGIFAANFRVAGPVSNPGITVNPLSALAPGVLRKLFLFNAPEPSAPTEQVLKPGDQQSR